MVYTDKKTGREIEVFTTKEEAKDGAPYAELEVTKNGNWEAAIGCWFDDQDRLVDYDGTFHLQMDCIRALRESGWTVPREFEH